jgi:hypothetical protein
LKLPGVAPALILVTLLCALAQPVQASAGERLGRLAGVLDREALRPIDPAVALPALREGVVALDIAPRPELERCLGRRQPRDLAALTGRIVTCLDLESLPAPQGAAAEQAIARLLVGQTGFAADSVISPEEMATLRGERAPGVIGLTLVAGPDAILVHQAMRGGTAQAAGIGQGWAVLAIDGLPHAPAELAQAVHALRGETGSEVTLVLRDTAGVEHRMVLERVAREAVFPVPVARRDGGMLEVAITEFAFGTSEQVRALVAREQRGLERIVLDLRGNTGGALEEAIMLADMAGHSKFKNIMHRKGAQDKKRSNLFSKLSREITVAAKMGMPDPDMNPRLRLAVNAAKAQSMPKDNIQRAIDKAAAAGGEDYEEVRYEGYGPGGSADHRGADRQPQPHRHQRAHRLCQEWRQYGRFGLGRPRVRAARA